MKVWLNRQFEKNNIVGSKIGEEQMVKAIVDVLDGNCDNSELGNTPSVRNYLYRNADMLKFDQALRELQNYVITYSRGYIPQKMECVDRVGGIYVIANRFKSQLDEPQNPLLIHTQSEQK